MSKNRSYVCKCRIFFTENRFQDESLFVYYMLENYYQNSRRYVKSLDSYQLIGLKSKNEDELTSDCEPFRYYFKNKNDQTKIKFEPCGAIANSIFNGIIDFVKEAVKNYSN